MDELTNALDVVDDKEDVVRYLLKKYYDSDLNQWTVKAFELRYLESADYHEQAISVSRSAMLPSIEYGKQISFPMKMQRNVIAFAELNVGQVRDLSSKNMDVNVLSIPTQNNPAHAGIVTHISDKLVVGVPSEPEFLDLQCQLLELAGRRVVFF